ncbi:hypothetical protein KEM54_006662 [Ascosphaera aggregata]|nr:hypothetical protein KEM54_006662 [Ascosphaera aggregata]
MIRRVEREELVMKMLSQQGPVGVKKMSSNDPGEKFWLSYWDLGDGTSSPSNLTRRNDGNDDVQARSDLNNYSIPLAPALPLHYVEVPRQQKWSRNLFSKNTRQLLSKRDYKCPDNSFPCDSIGRPDKCCGNGDTCQKVQDTGLGDVGCCSGNNNCASNSLDRCPWGYSNCPHHYGGGCCMPGYECVSEGCLYISTTTVYYQPPPTTYHTPAVVPAVRPTSNNGPVIYAEPTRTIGYCPTGYYSCAALYYGGCCRVDRECNPTSCPAPPGTTTEPAEPATIYVAPTMPVYGSCADGWFGCAASEGGGCCPNNYGCGVHSCTSTRGWNPTRTHVLPKATPDSAVDRQFAVANAPVLVALAVVVAGMVV